MGTAQSSDTARPGPLPEYAAFAMATHWRSDLLGWVRLTTHDQQWREPVAFVDPLDPATPHYEWVTFGESFFLTEPATIKRDVRRASAARASTIVWLAIASCPGYSVRENPRFWRRVFSDLWRGDRPGEMTADVRFFEHEDRMFPCVRFHPINDFRQPILSAFFRAGATERELTSMLERLAPFLAGIEWWRREVRVEIVTKCDSRLGLPRQQRPISARRPTFRQRPVFRVVAVCGWPYGQMLRTDYLHELAAEVDGANIHIPFCEVQVGDSLFSDIYRAPESLQFLRIGTLQKIRWTWAEESYRDDGPITAMCSALPYTRVFTALEFNWQRGQSLTRMHFAWLGYALFHPDTAHKSALTALVTALPYDGAEITEMLQLMATGNNLLVAMGETTTMSSAYHEARLARQTHVYNDDEAGSQIIYTFDNEDSVMLCVASVAELKAEAMVRIVVPGLGLGWVSTKQIVSVVSRAPGRSPLQRLELSAREHCESYVESVAPELLSILGASLTHLRVSGKMSPHALQAILTHCPKLVALGVDHDGECWSNPSLIESLPLQPRLRMLELTTDGPFKPLIARQLGDMTCLRVIDRTFANSSFDIHRNALLETLRRNPQLARVYWSSIHCNPPPWWETYRRRDWKPPRSDWQWTSYGLLGENLRGELDVAHSHSGLRLGERLAFLSIFGPSANDNSTRLPRLTADVVRLIFAFSTMTVPRRVLVRHSNLDQYNHPEDSWWQSTRLTTDGLRTGSEPNL